MRPLVPTALVALSLDCGATPPANAEIDMRALLATAQAAAVEHEARRIDDDTFVRWRGEPGAIVLDAQRGDGRAPARRGRGLAAVHRVHRRHPRAPSPTGTRAR